MKNSSRITAHRTSHRTSHRYTAHNVAAPNVARRISMAVLFALTLGMWSVAAAKLPSPTPEETAKKAAEAESAKEKLAKEQVALTKAQDSVVQRYRSDLLNQGITPPAPTPTEMTPQANLPKTLVDAPRNAGPTGGTKPSAEAHSGNAK